MSEEQRVAVNTHSTKYSSGDKVLYKPTGETFIIDKVYSDYGGIVEYLVKNERGYRLNAVANENKLELIDKHK